VIGWMISDPPDGKIPATHRVRQAPRRRREGRTPWR
jgi:hypothetical protein